jgi:Kef-type K+ transport system membrane component KefB/predicted transcriptional regulator
MLSILAETTVDSSHHLNVIFLLGLAVFGGTIGGKLFQRLRIPQVVGYIVIGIILGGSALGVIGPQVAESLSPFNIFALGIIGFMIGGELQYEIFKRYGKQFIIILLAEGMTAFFLVSLAVTATSYLFTGNAGSSLALGLLLGAISSATAPAATVDVLWEYKTRGILTRTILAIVALDDGLALLLYGFAASFADTLLGQSHASWLVNLALPLWEIFGAIALGAIVGFMLVLVFRYIQETDKLLTFTIASLTLTIGLSNIIRVEPILAAMVLGATLVNFRPRRSRDAFELVETFSPPIYVLFFVLVGARLRLTGVPAWIVVLAAVYVVGRSAGKMTGAWLGAAIARAPAAVRRYLGICLFSQAGVAVGLSLLASERFGNNMGEAIVLIITVTTFLVQVFGPILVKAGVVRAGEVGMNITEDDLIRQHAVGDVMDKSVPTIPAGMGLAEVIRIVSQTDRSYYPVVSPENRLLGAITLHGIRNTFATQELNSWLVALDVVEPVIAKVTPQVSLSHAFEEATRHGLQYLPVVDSDQEDAFVGVLDCPAIHRSLAAEVLSRQKKADSMHGIGANDVSDA